MARWTNGAVLRQMRTLFQVGTVGGLSDGELLERFVSRGGEAGELAFEALVTRHGPMVFRVCQDVLRDPHDAQDAFQATFLVLIRKAHAIRRRDSVASWLYGVALRVATATRTASARRKAHERQAAEHAEVVSSDPDPSDLGPVLHEEVNRLSEKYRAPVVLCYFEGLTHEMAAHRLDWPVGTVRSRLARAREILRGRLTRRGLAPALGAAGALLVASETATATVPAAVPTALVAATVRAGTTLVSSQAGMITAGAVSASVAAITEGVLNVMFWTKLKLTAATVLTAGIVVTGAGVLAQQPGGDQPSRRAGIATASDRPDPPNPDAQPAKDQGVVAIEALPHHRMIINVITTDGDYRRLSVTTLEDGRLSVVEDRLDGGVQARLQYECASIVLGHPDQIGRTGTDLIPTVEAKPEQMEGKPDMAEMMAGMMGADPSMMRDMEAMMRGQMGAYPGMMGGRPSIKGKTEETQKESDREKMMGMMGGGYGGMMDMMGGYDGMMDMMGGYPGMMGGMMPGRARRTPAEPLSPQEQRLQDVERKLDEILQLLKERSPTGRAFQ